MLFKKGFWDRLGISLSGLCAIHCLLAPVAVALIPLWPAFEKAHEHTHLIFFLAIAPTVILSLQRKHASPKVSSFLIIGVIIIFLAWFFNQHLGEFGEAGITLVGSGFLIRGHWMNYRMKVHAHTGESELSQS